MLASADDNLNDSVGSRHETESIIFYQDNHRDTRSCVAMIARRKLPAATTFNIQHSKFNITPCLPQLLPQPVNIRHLFYFIQLVQNFNAFFR